MFHPLPLFVGLRYARARTHRYFVSFITWVSLGGVCVGVAALIVILSVMNGFGSELRDRLLALSVPVRINAVGPQHPDWSDVAQQIAGVPGATAEPYAELQVLGIHQTEMVPLMLRAMGPVTGRELSGMLVDGSVAPVERGEGVLLSQIIARRLGVNVGDALKLLVPVVIAGAPPDFRLQEFQVVGLFEPGVQDHDPMVYTSLDVLKELGASRSGAEGLAVRLPDPLQAATIAGTLQQQLQQRWPGQLRVTDWTEEHASYFRAIRIEKTMMALILLLIVAVAAFNIVAMLVMVVTEKRTDIAILRTFGAEPRALAGVFVAQGLVIGWMGVLVGVGLGVLVATHVQQILGFVDRVAGWQLFDADVYLFTAVPSELHGIDVLVVSVCALAVTALATIYPAMRAAATSPAEALRYE